MGTEPHGDRLQSSKRFVGRRQGGQRQSAQTDSAGRAQFDDARLNTGDLHAVAGLETGLFQPASHDADFGFDQSFAEITFGLDLQGANGGLGPRLRRGLQLS